eukprot:TRINITY_DN22099_c0_g1_i1.p1 TRINITY_DN22099_c0_g1~~TRINITY_DN22099_c0_g1_i1.p1  ORF type:complete len:520 (-),score=155.39 TRINITY_DN22099_c0_g1_i1:154-1713(-)
MGCGGSVSREQLKGDLHASQAELQQERKRLQEQDAQIRSIRDCLQKQVSGSESSASAQDEAVFARKLDELRSEMEARKEHYAESLLGQRDKMATEHREELESMLQTRDESLLKALADRQQQAVQEAELRAAEQRQADEQAKELLASKLSEISARANEEVAQHHAEAQVCGDELQSLRRLVGPLREEHAQAAEALREARRALRLEQDERAGGSRASGLEQRLAEANRDHERAEQRHADLQQHLKAQMRELQSELHSRAEDLRERDTSLARRNAELAEVNGQLADLQSLFDEVNGQLQTECSRIGRLQGAVELCAKQTKELESLQNMLEESHRMLAQLRDRLDTERSERIRVSGLLEHEQQRTQLLLDVLKHFKEKLQGLTPQMLLSRLGVTDPKALLEGVPGTPGSLAGSGLNLDSLGLGAMPSPSKGMTGPAVSTGLSPCPAVPFAAAAAKPTTPEPAWLAPSPAHHRQPPAGLHTGPWAAGKAGACNGYHSSLPSLFQTPAEPLTAGSMQSALLLGSR